MATIDIDLSDFDFDDLVNEVTRQINRGWKMSGVEKQAVEELRKSLNLHPVKQAYWESDNLAEQLKHEYLTELKDQYTEQQIRLAIGYWEFHNKPSEY